MPSKPNILETARLIRIAGNSVRSGKEDVASEIGLTFAQAEALHYLQSMSDPKIKDLAKAMGVTHQAACGIVDRMSDKGLVYVKTSEDDCRARIISISPDGQATYEKLNRLGMDNITTLFHDLSDEELDVLNGLMKRICKNM